MARVCGSLTIVCLVFGIAAAFGGEAAIFLAGFVAAALVVMGIGAWSDPAMPKGPKEWGWMLFGAPILGGLIFLVEVIVGKLAHPELGLFEAGLHTGPFGGALTLAGTASMMVISVGGVVHGLVERLKGANGET